MKAEELKTKTIDELNKLLLDTRKEQFNLRFQRSQGALEKTAEMRKAKRNIARIKTFMTEKARGSAPVAKKAPAKKAAPAQRKEAKTESKTETKKAAPKKAAAKKSA